MSHSGPYFHAWCAEEDRIAAYTAALDRLCTPKAWDGPPSMEEATRNAHARIQADFDAEDYCAGGGTVVLVSGDRLNIDLVGWRSQFKYDINGGPLFLKPEEQYDLLFFDMPIALGSVKSVEIEAAIFTIETLDNTTDLLMRLCVPDETSRVTTGACTWEYDWAPGPEACMTYNADSHVARDIALSWLYGLDGSPIELTAGLDIHALRARIVATPTSTRARVVRDSTIAYGDDVDHSINLMRPLNTPMVTPNPGQRMTHSAGHEMSREQVLAVLETPPARLLEALESAAEPGEEWRAIEPIVLECIEAKKHGAPTVEVEVNTPRHIRFVEQHAPFHVRRLHNGGVMLATHPYRTLWPLWSSALDLLGIRPKSA